MLSKIVIFHLTRSSFHNQNERPIVLGIGQLLQYVNMPNFRPVSRLPSQVYSRETPHLLNFLGFSQLKKGPDFNPDSGPSQYFQSQSFIWCFVLRFLARLPGPVAYISMQQDKNVLDGSTCFWFNFTLNIRKLKLFSQNLIVQVSHSILAFLFHLAISMISDIHL